MSEKVSLEERIRMEGPSRKCPFCREEGYEWEWEQCGYMCRCGRLILDYEDWIVWDRLKEVGDR